mmetsp:Transcript_39620/g.92699  ORF Transcript_39620/g.92699 Transcript_39620/m.92699 type:complete len:261 (+) Transcript_39620:1598-2380(+)
MVQPPEDLHLVPQLLRERRGRALRPHGLQGERASVLRTLRRRIARARCRPRRRRRGGRIGVPVPSAPPPRGSVLAAADDAHGSHGAQADGARGDPAAVESGEVAGGVFIDHVLEEGAVGIGRRGANRGLGQAKEDAAEKRREGEAFVTVGAGAVAERGRDGGSVGVSAGVLGKDGGVGKDTSRPRGRRGKRLSTQYTVMDCGIVFFVHFRDRTVGTMDRCESHGRKIANVYFCAIRIPESANEKIKKIKRPRFPGSYLDG